MSRKFERSYFHLLPNEILVKILADVDTISLVNFCEALNCDYFLQERQVVKSVDLSKKYVLSDLSEITKKIAFEHIKTLNINCIYWIHVSKLRSLIRRLPNLENLYAIQTNISLGPSDTELLSKSKIKKLGVTLKKGEASGFHTISTMECLYLGVVNMKSLISPFVLRMIFPNLLRLWVDVEEPCGREMVLHCVNADNKTKIFSQINAPVPFMSFDRYSLSTYYNNRRANQPYVICCEKFSLPSGGAQVLESTLESWKVLEELRYAKPYGPRDARILFKNEKTLDNIFFEELNFYHINPVCNERCKKATKEILSSSCASRLRKLCIMMCLLERERQQDSIRVNSFKRKRVGIKNTSSSHPAKNVFGNFPTLEYLEIFICHQTSPYSVISGYPQIGLLSNLKTLIIEVPLTLDGSFLHEIFKKCTHLEVLKLTSAGQNEALNANLCTSIVDATSLKDFKYQNHRIQLDKLLRSFASVKSPKLERIVLRCKQIDKFSAAPLNDFLAANTRLVFLYFVLNECTKESLKMAQQTLNSYKKMHHSRIFLVKNDDSFDKLRYPVSDVHFYEMVKSDCTVATLRALDDFPWF